MSDLNGKPALNAALNSPQALTASLTSASSFSATMAPGIPLGGGGSYTLPPATATVLGGVKIGANVNVAVDGTISVAPPTSQTPWTSNIDAASFNLNNVGAIGIGAPSQGGNTPLYIANNSNPGPTVVLNNTNPNSNSAMLRFQSRSAYIWDFNVDYAQNGGTDLNLCNGVTNRRVTFLANGNVGIAKTNPAYPLDVTGDVNVSGVYRIAGNQIAAANVVNAVDSTQTYANPAWITSLDWNKLFNIPVLVNTFNGRAGAVVAASGDYTAAQVTNAVSTLGSYANPAWLTAVPWSILSGSPSSAQITAIQTPWLQDIAAATFRLLNAGNVGVGSSLATAPMTGPGTYLQVGSDTTTGTGRVMTCSNQPASLQIVGELDFVNFASASAEKRIAYIQGNSYLTAGTSGYLSFYTANAGAPAEHMRIGQAGVVQMGATMSGGTDFLNLYSNVLNQGFIVVTSPANGGAVSIRSTGAINYISSGNNTGSAAQDLQIANYNHSTTWMTFQASTGNVGIGTTNPGYPLDIVSGVAFAVRIQPSTSTNAVGYYAANSSSALYFGIEGSAGGSFVSGSTPYSLVLSQNLSQAMHFGTAGAIRATIANTGNVGIGTTSPSCNFHVLAASGSTQAQIENTAGTGDTGLVFKDANRQWKVGINVGGVGASKLTFWDLTGAASRMVIDTSGNVGIGTTSPGALLNVKLGTTADSTGQPGGDMGVDSL